jgi:hypothetical protein
MDVPKTSNSISRVKCVVDSCSYWQTGNHCLAQSIEIEPPGASDSETTDCATFAPKSQG